MKFVFGISNLINENIFSTQHNRLVIIYVQSMQSHKIAEGQLYDVLNLGSLHEVIQATLSFPFLIQIK